MESLGTLRVGDIDFAVVRIKPTQGRLQLQARWDGPADLAVPRAEWRAPDGTLVCVFEPFRVSEEEVAAARHPTISYVTVAQDIKIDEVVTTDQPSLPIA